MWRKQFSEEQIIAILKEAEAMLDNTGLKDLLSKNGGARYGPKATPEGR